MLTGGLGAGLTWATATLRRAVSSRPELRPLEVIHDANHSSHAIDL